MGGTDFRTTAAGKDANDAFSAAVRQAQWESGHGGYTGTIAEKHSFTMFQLPTFVTVRDLTDAMNHMTMVLQGRESVRASEARGWTVSKEDRKWASKPLTTGKMVKHQALVERMRLVYEDKFGPAVAVELTGTALVKAKAAMGLKGTRQKVYVFFGIASC